MSTSTGGNQRSGRTVLCTFAPRCRYALPECTAERPVLTPLGHGVVACLRAEELHPHELAKHEEADHG